MSEAQEVQRLLEELSRVNALVATYVGTSAGQAQIDLGGSRFQAAFVTGYVPVVGEAVNVWSIDGTWFLLGPTRPKPTVGTVVTVASPRATVSTSQGDVVAIIGGAAPTSGDRVLLTWTEDGPVTGLKLATTPTAPTPPPDPGGGGTTVKEALFRAVDAGSTDRGSARWWQTQPWASDSTYGAWFYGTAIKDTIPAGSVLVSAEIWINRVQDQGAAPRFTLHTSAYKAGIPAMSSVLTWDPPNGWNALPAGWFDALIGGGAYWGVGLNQGGFNKFAALAQDGDSGAIRIKWR